MYCNSEIFARVLFSRNLAYAKFRENKNPREMAKSLCRLLMKVTHVIVAICYDANMSFNTIRENNILAKISELTVAIFPFCLVLPYTEAIFKRKEVVRLLKKIAQEKKIRQELEAEKKQLRMKKERERQERLEREWENNKKN